VELREAARAALLESDPARKTAAVAALGAPGRVLDRARTWSAIARPGRPLYPELVHPARVPRRGLGTSGGRIALLHALAHIEFNAIDLALDAAVRFPGLPAAYYDDWLRVAREEAEHFNLLTDRLADLGAAYGDLPAHDGLWEAAVKTAGDCLARMALVPRVLEARGLDVTPGIQRRLRAVGDDAAAAVLDIILRDEIGHVAVANRWYAYLCAERGLDPSATFRRLCDEHGIPLPHPPFNRPARLAAGFDPAELEVWTAAANTGRGRGQRHTPVSRHIPERQTRD
jgi:uncharacterized ferritin-like protein (DUF455 family)